MNYENMSDFEINKSVAELRYQDCIELEVFQNSYNSSVADVVSQGVHITSFDFNNPSDAWLIITENKISLIEEGDKWGAYLGFELLENMEGGGCDFSHGWSDKNPLRAAMIVYLMMQEAK